MPSRPRRRPLPRWACTPRCGRPEQLEPHRAAPDPVRRCRPGRRPQRITTASSSKQRLPAVSPKPSGPVAELDPRAGARVYARDGFVISFWTYYEPAGPEIAPAGYAAALMRLHAALRQTDLAAPHFTERVAGAQREVGDRERTPALPGPDRELLSTTLSRLSELDQPPEQRRRAAAARRAASRATCSAQGEGRCSSTSRRAAAGRSSSTSPTPPKKPASTIRARTPA